MSIQERLLDLQARGAAHTVRAVEIVDDLLCGRAAGREPTDEAIRLKEQVKALRRIALAEACDPVIASVRAHFVRLLNAQIAATSALTRAAGLLALCPGDRANDLAAELGLVLVAAVRTASTAAEGALASPVPATARQAAAEAARLCEGARLMLADPSLAPAPCGAAICPVAWSAVLSALDAAMDACARLAALAAPTHS